MTARPSSLRIAGLQMLVTSAVAENERRIVAGIERAAADRADILLTPEGSLSGYRPDFGQAEVAAALARVRAAAKAANLGLALGTCFREQIQGEDLTYNQVKLYDPQGEFLGFHAKILRCSPLHAPGTGEMVHYAEGTLRTFEWNGARLGVLICNDLWATPGFTTMPNPYLAWQLKRMGAQIILHAIFSGRDVWNRRFLESSSAMWARALSLPIVQVNAVHGEDVRLNCPSGVLGRDGERLLSVADVGEQYFVCDVPLGE